MNSGKRDRIRKRDASPRPSKRPRVETSELPLECWVHVFGFVQEHVWDTAPLGVLSLVSETFLKAARVVRDSNIKEISSCVDGLEFRDDEESFRCRLKCAYLMRLQNEVIYNSAILDILTRCVIKHPFCGCVDRAHDSPMGPKDDECPHQRGVAVSVDYPAFTRTIFKTRSGATTTTIAEVQWLKFHRTAVSGAQVQSGIPLVFHYTRLRVATQTIARMDYVLSKLKANAIFYRRKAPSNNQIDVWVVPRMFPRFTTGPSAVEVWTQVAGDDLRLRSGPKSPAMP